jgi:hypothetical protein
MTHRYEAYEELRDRGVAARAKGDYDFGDALIELALLVLASREKAAAAALRSVRDVVGE